jgi:hypothetical protein
MNAEIKVEQLENYTKLKNTKSISYAEKQGCQMVYFLTKNTNLGKF